MSKQPFMPLFFGDFLASTAEWSGEERGMYLLLLSHQWSMGSLPTDMKRLARLIDYERRVFDAHWETVSKKFVEQDGRLFNLRLESHRDRAKQIGEVRSNTGRNGGIASGEARRRKAEANASTLLEPNAKQDGSKGFAFGQAESNHPIQSIPSQSKNSPDRSAPARTSSPDLALARTRVFADSELMDAFAVVRSVYPKFGGDQSKWILGERAWRERLEEGATSAELIAGVERYAAFVAAGGVSPRGVLGPQNFFDRHAMRWLQPWDPPATKGQQQQDENIAASQEWLARSSGNA